MMKYFVLGLDPYLHKITVEYRTIWFNCSCRLFWEDKGGMFRGGKIVVLVGHDLIFESPVHTVCKFS